MADNRDPDHGRLAYWQRQISERWSALGVAVFVVFLVLGTLTFSVVAGHRNARDAASAAEEAREATAAVEEEVELRVEQVCEAAISNRQTLRNLIDFIVDPSRPRDAASRRSAVEFVEGAIRSGVYSSPPGCEENPPPIPPDVTAFANGG